mmetsp:Transcript_49709/g.93042  ORF Transcript_49709/g.93042 Transcript_49709/m.93042 type:complete len:230 (-) Transcript_49709:53-742(-)
MLEASGMLLSAASSKSRLIAGRLRSALLSWHTCTSGPFNSLEMFRGGEQTRTLCACESSLMKTTSYPQKSKKIHESGELALQTRNARYGKLQNGALACVSSVYVRRQAQHLVTLPIGVMVVLGNNGWVWVCAPPKVAGSGRQETINFSQMDVRYQKVNPDMRERISRVRNAVLCLVGHGLEVTPDSISFLYEQSEKLELAAWELLDAARCDSAGLIDSLASEAMRTSRN